MRLLNAVSVKWKNMTVDQEAQLKNSYCNMT